MKQAAMMSRAERRDATLLIVDDKPQNLRLISDFLAEQGTITPGDQDIIDFVDTADEAWEIISRFYKLGE